MPITHVNALAEAAEIYTNYSYMHKPASSGASTYGGQYLDSSFSSGTPKFNAYAGASSALNQFIGNGNAGIFTGVTPQDGQEKYIIRASAHYDHPTLESSSSGTMHMIFADYLAFYPLIDLSDDSYQTMDNTLTLPRFTSGDGVQATIITTVASSASTTMTITYTNSDGVSGLTSTIGISVSPSSGIPIQSVPLSNNSTTPFIPIDGKGIRSIDAVQVSAAADGFCAIVLMKPLFQLQTYQWRVTSEKNFISDEFRPVKIENGAYLNALTRVKTNARGFNFRAEILTTIL